jgi:hypothetical protein
VKHQKIGMDSKIISNIENKLGVMDDRVRKIEGNSVPTRFVTKFWSS